MEEEKKQINKDTNNPQTLRTYMSDMADAIRENEMSVIKVALAEQKARERGDLYRKIEGSPTKKIFWVIGGIIIIVAAIFSSYYIIQKTKEKNQPPQIIKTIETPISYDSKINLDATKALTKIDIANLLNSEINKKEGAESVKAIFLDEKIGDLINPLSLNNLFSKIGATAPSSLIRAFSENYLIGTYTPSNTYEKAHLFLIIGVNDYNSAYAGMLEWEKTILSDLFTLFDIDVSGENNELLERPFKDIVIKNKDARILYNRDGVDALFYLFPDKNTLVITDNQNAVKEIIVRLLVEKTKL